jgi:hypothetical protein
VIKPARYDDSAENIASNDADDGTVVRAEHESVNALELPRWSVYISRRRRTNV